MASAAEKPEETPAKAEEKKTAEKTDTTENAAENAAKKAAKKTAKKAAKKADGTKDGKKRVKRGKPRNYNLGNGLYRFSRTKMYHKKALYKFIGKKTPPAEKPKKPLTIEKPIGGEKNGGTRIVLLKKRKNYYPTQDKIKKRPSKKSFKQHKRYLRSSLKPGTICVLLAGPHKGKRVVFLKQLKTGLLLVTGPFQINACPLRRINQIYVIGTRTRINIRRVKIPKHVDDKYFRRERKKRAKKEEGDIFSTKKETYKVDEKRKVDQKLIDSQVIKAIKKHPDKKLLYTYLASMFGLRSSQYPHRMQF